MVSVCVRDVKARLIGGHLQRSIILSLVGGGRAIRSRSTEKQVCRLGGLKCDEALRLGIQQLEEACMFEDVV